jgi:hypothetical protein
MRSQFYIFTEHELAHGLLGTLAERLASFRCINKSEADPDMLFAKDQHVDRVAIDHTCYAPVDSRVFQAKSVRDGRGHFLAKNAKSAQKNKQGDESGKHATASSSFSGYLSF